MAVEPDTDNAANGNDLSIARQPIVDADQTVIGYELFNRSQNSSNHSLASDVSMVLHALAQSGTSVAAKGMDLFVNTTHEGLSGEHWDFLNARRTVIEIPAVAMHQPEQIESIAAVLLPLRERGFRLAFGYWVVAPQYKSWHALADFVKVDSSAIDAQKMKPLTHAIHTRTGALSIAERVESVAQFEVLRDAGFLFFQGYWVSHPEIVRTKTLNPSQIGALQLFNLLHNDAEIDDITAMIKKDVTLSFNLLRIVNAAAFAREQRVDSIRQAVRLLGTKKLQKWAAVLMTAGSSGKASLTGATAVVRARMMELLAEHAMGPTDTEPAFLIGLFSQLDRLLGCTLSEALNMVQLDDGITETLLHQSGKFSPLLQMAIACESDDGELFSAAAGHMNLTYRQINLAHMEALVWADQLQGEAG